MSEEKHGRKRDELIELKTIRNLLILQLLKSGATSEEIDLATKMGAGNIRRLFPGVKMFPGVKKRGKTPE